jgi:hypothetical protein
MTMTMIKRRRDDVTFHLAGHRLGRPAVSCQTTPTEGNPP